MLEKQDLIISISTMLAVPGSSLRLRLIDIELLRA